MKERGRRKEHGPRRGRMVEWRENKRGETECGSKEQRAGRERREEGATTRKDV